MWGTKEEIGGSELRIPWTWDSNIHEDFLNSAFICDVSVGGEVKGTTWGDSCCVNEDKCQLSGFCAFRNSGAHSPHPHLYPNAIQHNWQDPCSLSAALIDYITPLLKSFQGLPTTTGQIKCIPLVLKSNTAVLHIRMTATPVSPRKPLYSEATFYFISLNLLRGQLFLFSWSRQGQ